mmetsp:Transcript_139461/g.353683  ORF Transcript_139461/g.353683 Transcript_139461/m.353683 type:complete len:240 (+) Transcript_139461:358-1077(+)
MTLPLTPVFSTMTPTSNISVLTKLWPSLRDSSWAFHTTFKARSLKRSNIMLMEKAPELDAVGAAAGVTEPAIEEPKKAEVLEETPPTLELASPPPGAPAVVRTITPDFPLSPRLGTTALKREAKLAAKAVATAAAAALAETPRPVPLPGRAGAELSSSVSSKRGDKPSDRVTRAALAKWDLPASARVLPSTNDADERSASKVAAVAPSNTTKLERRRGRLVHWSTTALPPTGTVMELLA